MAERVLDLRVPARAEELKNIRAAVRRCAEQVGMGESCVQDVVIIWHQTLTMHRVVQKNLFAWRGNCLAMRWYL